MIARRASVLFYVLLVTFLSALALPAQADDYQISLDEVHLFVDKTLVPVEQDIECWAWCDYTLTLPQGEEEELEAGGEGDVYVKETYTWNWDGGSATSIEGDHHYKVNYAASGNYTIQVTCNVEVRRIGTDELLASAGPKSKTANVSLVKLTATSVDASTPASTKVNYNLEPAGVTLPSATFTAPGKSEGKTKLSGTFYCTYDQGDVNWSYESNVKWYDITLTGTLPGGASITETIQVSRIWKTTPPATEVVSAYFLVEGVGLRTYVHSLWELHHQADYSITSSGKKAWVGESTALLHLGQDYEEISDLGWTETHKYTYAGGGTEFASMSTWSGMLPENTRCKEAKADMWLTPTDLTGIARVQGLIYNYGGGVAPASYINNREVDRSIP